MAASRPAHTNGRVCGPLVLGHDHLRIDRLPAADPLGPATRRFPREGADRGKELRHVSRDGAVSLSSPSVGHPCTDGAENGAAPVRGSVGQPFMITISTLKDPLTC